MRQIIPLIKVSVTEDCLTVHFSIPVSDNFLETLTKTIPRSSRKQLAHPSVHFERTRELSLVSSLKLQSDHEMTNLKGDLNLLSLYHLYEISDTMTENTTTIVNLLDIEDKGAELLSHYFSQFSQNPIQFKPPIELYASIPISMNRIQFHNGVHAIASYINSMTDNSCLVLERNLV